MEREIKEAIDKLFEKAQDGDDNAGRILCEIFNEARKATMTTSKIPSYPPKLRII